MKLITPITQLAGQWLIERPAHKRSYAEHRAALQANTATIRQRIEKASDNEQNHRVLTHIIGIERWGQTRLGQFLGRAPGEVEYDNYRPARSIPWEDLPELFQTTRQETLHLLDQLEQATPTPPTLKHDTFGNLSDRGWLRYLRTHAELESKKLR